MINLTVFCSGKHDLKQDYIDEINELVMLLDSSKIAVVYGGGTVGLMGVVRNAFNGKIITSNMHIFKDDNYEDDYLFDNITERQKKLVDLGNAFLILPGGFGTLFELLEVVTKNQIGEASKPIFVYNYKGIYDNLLLQIKKLQEEGFVKHSLEHYKLFIHTDKVELATCINALSNKNNV
jgi:uncharacterized protein (TIGR00730 family)